MTAGVYRIHCKANDSYYVGESSCVERRLKKQHVGDLKAGRHVNVELQRAWRKYGQHQFTFEVIWALPFECEELLSAREIASVTRHQEAVIGLAMMSEGMRLMNIADLSHWDSPSPALSPLVQLKMSNRLRERWQNPDQRDKFSTAKKRMWDQPGMRERMSKSISDGWKSESAKASRSGENHWRARPVKCIETGDIYNTSADASRALGFKGAAISNAIRRKLRCGGFSWAYVL